MNILRNILRVGLIILLVILLVFISMKIFNLIPKAINNLASATVSIGGLTDEKTANQAVNQTNQSGIDENIPAQPVAPTANGLNGVVIQPENTTASNSTGGSTGNTVTNTTTVTPNKVNTTTSKTASKTSNPTDLENVRYIYDTDFASYALPKNTTTSYGTYSYIPRTVSTAKNIKLTLTSVGIIDSYGQFVQTNTFNVNDTVSVKFKILNEEAGSTGTWNLRVTMPAIDVNDRVKNMTNLSSIPGESSYVAEARFTGIDLSRGTPVVQIYADPENSVRETNESDNILSVELRNVRNNYSNNYDSSCYTDSYGNRYCNNYNGYNNNYYQNQNQCYSHIYGWYNCGGSYNYDYNNGNANLMISSVEVGRMVGGSFYQSTSIPYGERVAVRVTVRNTGGYFNNSWTTRLGVQNIGTGYREFSSTNGPIQSGGEQIVYFELTDLIRGNQTLDIRLDANNNVYESNESDNTRTVGVYIN